MTPEATDPTAGEGLSEAERRDLFNAWVATGTPTDWEHAVERIVAARESAAATRARAEVVSGVRAWCAINEIAEPPLDWAGLGEFLAAREGR